jgi:glycosyltransferase involved in cell wall biosynthesis
MPAAILHLLRSAQREETGPARIVAALASRLDPSKYHLHAWFLGPPGPLVEDLEAAGATARSIEWTSGLRDPMGAYQFWSCLRDHDFAIVHHHFAGRIVRQIIRASSKAPVVVQLHARISEIDAARSVPVAVRNADLVIAVSHAVARQVQNQKPIVVYSGVESCEGFNAANMTGRTSIVVGAACRLVDIKGLSDLIRAIQLLSLEFPSLHLEIAGDGPELENLQDEARLLGMTARIRFLGWQRELGPIFRSWDIFAMPSLTEGFPMAALEAMAQELPVVATNVGGLPELVEDGRTGYLVPPSNVEALARGLRTLILDPKRRQEMGAAGGRRSRKHFSVDRMVAQTVGIYESLLAARK